MIMMSEIRKNHNRKFFASHLAQICLKIPEQNVKRAHPKNRMQFACSSENFLAFCIHVYSTKHSSMIHAPMLTWTTNLQLTSF